MEVVRSRRHSPPTPNGWGVLLSEALLLVLLTVALVALVWRVPGDRTDAGFLSVLALGLYSVAFWRLVARVQRFLDVECPDCTENFHGLPDRLPVPFRSHCAHCGRPGLPPA
jgi:hypothetical protein